MITDFPGDCGESGSLRDCLWLAADRDRAGWLLGAGLPEDPDEFSGPFEENARSIVVGGAAREVPALACPPYQAFRFRGGSALVTVLTRHQVRGRARGHGRGGAGQAGQLIRLIYRHGRRGVLLRGHCGGF